MVERVPLGTLPQAVVTTLAHNHMTNLFISNYRNSVIEVDRALLHWG